MFRKKKEEDIFPETNDILIIFDDELKTSDIQRITEIKEDSILVNGRYNIPLEDCEVTNSQEGRNFFYKAPTRSITETKRLAQLEKSIVLQQITNYKASDEDSKMDIMKILLIITIIVAFIMFGISGCQGG